MEGNSLQEDPGIAFWHLCDKAASMGVKPAQLASLDSAKPLKKKPRSPRGKVCLDFLLKTRILQCEI